MFDDGNYKNKVKSIYPAGWKDHYFKSSGV